jgi:hypothetical protein
MDPLLLSKNDEFFIAIAQQGIHSFIMLGVRTKTGLHLLARVGKANDIDEDFGNETKLITKVIFGKKQTTRLADEGLTRNAESIPIRYCAYDMTYEQLCEFYSLLETIENTQKSSKPSLQTSKYDLEVYLPTSEEGDKVKFEFKKIQDFKAPQTYDDERLVQSTQELDYKNTCRTTAIDIIKKITGFMPNVSFKFFIKLPYTSTLIKGVPNAQNFYVLPPPPNCFDQLSPEQQKVMQSIYQRLESIPFLNPESEKTRKKFDALKNMYLELAPKQNLSITALLTHINEFSENNQQVLFEHRSDRFSLFQSTKTEKLFTKIKAELDSKK